MSGFLQLDEPINSNVSVPIVIQPSSPISEISFEAFNEAVADLSSRVDPGNAMGSPFGHSIESKAVSESSSIVSSEGSTERTDTEATEFEATVSDGDGQSTVRSEWLGTSIYFEPESERIQQEVSPTHSCSASDLTIPFRATLMA